MKASFSSNVKYNFVDSVTPLEEENRRCVSSLKSVLTLSNAWNLFSGHRKEIQIKGKKKAGNKTWRRHNLWLHDRNSNEVRCIIWKRLTMKKKIDYASYRRCAGSGKSHCRHRRMFRNDNEVFCTILQCTIPSHIYILQVQALSRIDRWKWSACASLKPTFQVDLPSPVPPAQLLYLRTAISATAIVRLLWQYLIQ